jgi:hypothetical protein
MMDPGMHEQQLSHCKVHISKSSLNHVAIKVLTAIFISWQARKNESPFYYAAWNGHSTEAEISVKNESYHASKIAGLNLGNLLF